MLIGRGESKRVCARAPEIVEEKFPGALCSKAQDTLGEAAAAAAAAGH